jgi:spore germination cell wall hydrolase CwlJ-like protein
MNKIKLGVLVAMLGMTMKLGQGEYGSLSMTQPKKQDIACLAKNIYMEARGEPIEGQIAVAQVTLNRLNTGDFGSTICKVVYAKNQFSWTNEKAKPIKANKEWEASIIVATAVLKGSIHLPNFNALYFHTRQVRPMWAKTKTRVARIANHIFYA